MSNSSGIITSSGIPTNSIPIGSTITGFVPTGSTTSIPLSLATISTATIANYVAPEPSLVVNIPVDCPNLNSKSLVTQAGDKFSMTCDFDFETGLPSAQDGRAITDLAGIISYSVSDCLNACSAFTFQAKNWGRTSKCYGISFDPDM